MAVFSSFWTLVLLILLPNLVQCESTAGYSSWNYDYGQEGTTDSEFQTTDEDFETGTSSWPEDSTGLPSNDTTADPLEDTTSDTLANTTFDPLEDTTIGTETTGWSFHDNATFQQETTEGSFWTETTTRLKDSTSSNISEDTTRGSDLEHNTTNISYTSEINADYNTTSWQGTTGEFSWNETSLWPNNSSPSNLQEDTTGWNPGYNTTFQIQTTEQSSWNETSTITDVRTSNLSDYTTPGRDLEDNSTTGTTEWIQAYNTSSQPGTTEVHSWNETSPQPEGSTPIYPYNDTTFGITPESNETVRNDTPGWTYEQFSTVETLANTTEIRNDNSTYLSSTQSVTATSWRAPTENGTSSSPEDTTGVDSSNQTAVENSTWPTTAVDTASSSTESSPGVVSTTVAATLSPTTAVRTTTVAATLSPTTAVRTTIKTPTTTKPSDAAKQQRELYPWGSTASDSQIKKPNNLDYWYWYDMTSQPIYFTGGVPVGSRKFQVAYVKSNGVVLFGTSDGGWWPNGEYSYSQGQTLLAPYWFDTNYEQKGAVFYHLYQRADTQDSSPYNKQILDRATLEVQEFTGDQNFVALSALVVTWWQVEPYRWYYWVCDYYRYYSSYTWWDSYYKFYYNQYCLQQYKETNTFQTVYVTNGQEAYTITTYKYGEMQWQFEMYRNIFVGYVTTDDVRDYGVTNTEQATKLDKMMGNTGRYGTWIEQVGKIINPDGRCLQFYLANLPVISSPQHQKFVQDLFDCPCSLDRLGAQWWSYSWDNLPDTPNYYSYRVCYAISSTAKTRLVRLQKNPLNKLCCYILNYPKNWWSYWIDWWDIYRGASYVQYRDPQAGHLLLNDPWYWQGDPRKSREEDFNPHRWCCQDANSPSKSCALFNVVRPDYGCSQDAEFITGVALGDPQFVTPDNRTYTFNGLGEFILVNTDSFIFQCRTGQASNAQGQPTSATVFIAFAVKDGENATFQVELDTLKTGMVITACGSDITNAFYQTENYSQMLGNSDVGVKREDRNNKTTVIASFPSGFSVKVNLGKRNLEFSVDVPRDYQGKTSGLLGNCNGDPSDDLKTPEGKVLTAQETNTERKIYEACMQWMVTTSNSVFQYSEGQSALTFQNSTFQPTFIEDYTSADLEKARNVCGENNKPCISDYLATQDEELALNTLNVSKETTNIKISQANNPPKLFIVPNQLNSLKQWEVTHGITVNISFIANDTDVNDFVSYILAGNATNSTSISLSGVLTYTPNASEPVILKVQAKDSHGAFSSAIYLDLVICSGCSGHGSCNPNLTREQEFVYGRFLIRTCICRPAYTGEDCQEDLDGCSARPCSPNQTCTDLSPSEQGNNLTGYTCGPCPTGFIKAGSGACIDQNECIANGTEPICGPHANCTNTYGSYECNCHVGYRKDPNNNTLCTDINECQERTDHCDQICINQEGNYSCACYNGSTLNADGRTCKQDNLTGCPQCEHFCVAQNGSFSCECRAGYKLFNNTNCIDIDECRLASRPCSQGCNNTQGGFTCSCYLGYTLSQDGVSCTACSPPYYGKNCASVCVCNGQGNCSSVQGCQCKPGWTGQNCDQDVDECATNSTACPAGQLCSNTKGSFKCFCPVGYVLSGGKCQDVDECLDILANNCTLSVEECVNNPGSYGCKCRTGYARNSNGTCQDIDECLAKSHNCEQQCQNTPGAYNCKCYYGYHLNADRSHCIQDEVDVCAGTSQTCNGVCTVDLATNQPVCKCNSGYSLVSGKCQDIDECKFDHLNLCSYKSGCNNTEGGYTCTCPQGSVLDNDHRTCQDCVSGKWGDGCSKDCNCTSGASRCDKAQGCVCQKGYQGEFCGEDLDECATGILTCQGLGESCVNTPSNASCQCVTGYERIGGSCRDIDECASGTNNRCDQLCQNTPGSYSCSCNLGYTFNSGSQSCHDINECDLKLDHCEQICVNTEGAYRCSCPAGMKLNTNGTSCLVVDACTNKICSDKCALVQQTETCFCPRGKVVNDSKCDDVDMCEGNTCTDKTSCKETDDGTGFICSCKSGQKLAADGYTCVDCTEGTYGVNCAQTCTCSPTSTQSCNKINGTCNCKDGWKGTSCSEDVNECENLPKCHRNSTCTNTLGSYVCKCGAGYFTSQNVCEACPPGRYGLECRQLCTCNLQNGECDAVDGLCRCKTGWNGISCDNNLDECLDKGNDCIAANLDHWVCFNSPGSYKCDCEEGYEKNSDSSCVNMDECATDFSNQCEQSCTDTEGSYTCSCQAGYTLAADGHSCQDIDECQPNAGLCQQVCVNEKGTFRCSCQDGYQLSDTDNSTCYASVGVSIILTVPKDVSGLNLREQNGKDFINLKNIIEPELKKQLLKTVVSLIRVVITQLRQGSLVINFDVTLDKSMDTNAASKMVEAIMLLFNNGVTIDGTFYKDVTLVVGNITVDSKTDKCLILEYIEACTEDETCAKNSNGMVYCSKKASTDLGLVMGLSIGLPVGAALVVLLIGLVCYYKSKYTKLKRIHVREANYEQDNRTPSPVNSTYFVIGPSSSGKTSNNLPEDKQNLYY